MTDDQGWGDLSCHGNAIVTTPILDELAASSVRFDRFFVSPVCAPTRAALLTGRFPARTGVTGVTGRREVMRAEELTIAEVFRSAGYRTGCFGKWHNGEQYPNHPLGQGFDRFFGFCGGHWNQYFDAKLQSGDRWVQTEGYITDVITDAAIEFVQRPNARPFFCYVPYNAPHTPWQVPDTFFEKYADQVDDPATACAYAMIDNLDGNIGRLLSAIENAGLQQNTIVVFLTDNGPNGPRFNGNMRGRKGSVHEGGCRVPCFLAWPGTLTPRLVRPIAAHIDLMPTLADLCGIDLPESEPLDGISLADLLRGEVETLPDRSVVTYWPMANGIRGAVRTQRFRYVRERGRDQLYDLVADPTQKTDLARQDPARLGKLKAEFDRFHEQVMESTAATLPVPAGFAEASTVALPGVEARLSGNVRFANGNGFAHDWITDWTSVDDSVTWSLQVEHATDYIVVLHYASQGDNTGGMLQLRAGDQRLEVPLPMTQLPARFARPERSQQKGPRWIREFASLELGKIRLRPGPAELELRAIRLNGKGFAEVDSLELRRVTDER